MLTVTDDAASAMRTALQKAAMPPTAGMRISTDHAAVATPAQNGNGSATAGNRPMLRLDVVTETPEDDEVVIAPGGLQVFIERDVAPLLEDKVLDGEVEPGGRSSFRIVRPKD